MPSRAPIAASSAVPLTRRAAEYGAALPLDDVRRLAARLYRYNSLPASPAWRRRVPDERAAERLLGLDLRDSHRSSVWRMWDACDPPRDGPMFKLYVSPCSSGTGAACRVLLAEMERPDGPFSLKVAADPVSLLRPDRLIAYFTSKEACLATARRVAPLLAGMRPQGVPFTAALADGHLLSWGADPPAELAAGLPEEERSWRGWVTARMAEALVAEPADRAGRDRATAALARLALLGVDTAHWTPPW